MGPGLLGLKGEWGLDFWNPDELGAIDSWFLGERGWGLGRLVSRGKCVSF